MAAEHSSSITLTSLPHPHQHHYRNGTHSSAAADSRGDAFTCMSFLLKFAVGSEVSALTLSLFYLDCWTPVIADECDRFSTIEDHVIIFRFAAGRTEMPLL